MSIITRNIIRSALDIPDKTLRVIHYPCGNMWDETLWNALREDNIYVTTELRNIQSHINIMHCPDVLTQFNCMTFDCILITTIKAAQIAYNMSSQLHIPIIAYLNEGSEIKRETLYYMNEQMPTLKMIYSSESVAGGYFFDNYEILQSDKVREQILTWTKLYTRI